jgi:hypothetical protein
MTAILMVQNGAMGSYLGLDDDDKITVFELISLL